MAGSNGLRMALGAAAAAAILGLAVVVEPLLRPGVAAPPMAVAAPAKVAPPVEAVAVAPVTPDAVQTEPVAPPVIDVVRIAPDGTGIVAGTAVAGTAVSVMLGGQTVAETVADGSGSFAAFVALPPSDQPRILSLIADPTGAAVVSGATVIVAPTPVAVPDVVVAQATPPLAADPVEDVAIAAPDVVDTVEPEPVARANVPEPVTAPVTEPVTPPAPAPQTAAPAQTTASADTATVPAAPETAPNILDSVAAMQAPITDAPGIAPVLRLDETGVRVLQPAIAPGATPEVLATVALDAIAYDAAGDVQLSGRAAGGGTVRVYVDNRVIIEVPVGQDGQWTSGLPDVPTGVYTMRVDQLAADGTVTSRIETPFLREERATIAAVMVDQTTAPDFTVAVKTVQPGATLWAIARERYGDGVMYVQVFEANRDRIRNPDLIYPGQVFVLPDVVAQ